MVRRRSSVWQASSASSTPKANTLGQLRPGDTFVGGRFLQISLRGLSKGKLLQNKLRHNQADFEQAMTQQETEIQTGKLLKTIEDEAPSASIPPSGQLYKSGVEQLQQNKVKPHTPYMPSMPSTSLSPSAMPGK